MTLYKTKRLETIVRWRTMMRSPLSFHFREISMDYNERMVNNVITLLIIIGIILLIAVTIISVVVIGGGALIFCFGDLIIAIVCIVLIVKLIKRIRNGKKQK